MPLLNELLPLIAQLRLGAAQMTPAAMGKAAADLANDTRNSDEDVRALVGLVENAVREVHGEDGVAKFQRRYWQYARR